MLPLYTIKHISQLVGDRPNATESVDSGLQNFRMLQGYETSDGLEFILQQDAGISKFQCINSTRKMMGNKDSTCAFVLPYCTLKIPLKMRGLLYHTNFREGKSNFTFYSPNDFHVHLTLFLSFFCLP